MITAVIFDMDGLLIDSEPLWRQAEIEVFKTVGIALDDELAGQTMGLRVDEVVAHWHHKQPWSSPSQAEIADRIDHQVVELVKQQGAAMPGVTSAIELCKSLGLTIAVASSSAPLLIDTVLDKLGITQDISVICSAHNESHGKPHPAVFLTTLHELSETMGQVLKPEQCLVFEDSVNGVIAAKAAKMKCIAIPAPEFRDDTRFGAADLVLGSLEDFNRDILESF